MRNEKTHKIIANFIISGKKPLCELVRQKTTDKAWIFSCYDNSED